MPKISNGYGLVPCGNDAVYFCDNEYDFFKFDFNSIVEVSHSEYIEAKFGAYNLDTRFERHCVGHFSNGNFITGFYQENNRVRIHDRSGEVKFELPIKSKFLHWGIEGIAVDANDKIWISVPLANYVGQFDLDGNCLFEISNFDGVNPVDLYYPNGLCVIGHEIYICDSGNRRIATIYIDDYNFKTYLPVPESVYQFVRVGDYDVYQLHSGLYYSPIGTPPIVEKKYLL